MSNSPSWVRLALIAAGCFTGFAVLVVAASIAFVFYSNRDEPTRLEAIKLLPLEVPIEQVVALYGDPIETAPTEDFPDGTTYTFAAGDHHEVVVHEWRGRVHTIAYWSQVGHPNRDLRHMFQFYGEGSKWTTINEGYLYYREDRYCALWCSAVPAIGVGTIEYRDEKLRRRDNQREAQGSVSSGP